MSNNGSGLMQYIVELAQRAQESVGPLHVDVKEYSHLLPDPSAAHINQFLGHVETKKRLLAMKQSPDFNMCLGHTYTEGQSTVLYDPAVFGKKHTRDKVLEQGLVRPTRGRNGTTVVYVDLAIAHIIHSCPEIEQFVIDTFKQFGRAMLALKGGNTSEVVIALDEAAKAVVAAELESEGEVATAKRIKARQDSIIARCGLTDAIRDRKLESSLSYGTVTDMINLAIFGHRARVLRTGLELPLKGRESPRTFASTNCNYAFKYAESMLTDNILKGTCRCTDDVQRILARFQPMLQSMANHLGDEPVLLERNDRTWQLAEGETTASLKNKQLTHQN